MNQPVDRQWTMVFAAAAALLVIAVGAVKAQNVDLSTIPARDTVQLTIYNTEDLTLVRETRTVSFKKGANSLQFSWANTLIDPTSVQLRFLTDADRLTVLDTTFPHAKPHMLYWNVQSELEGEARVEITYFTSGIRWSADYLCIAEPDESRLRLEGFVRVDNRSGEEYENAQVRLVVGKINLVEKIAQLARLALGDVAKLRSEERNRLGREVLKESLERADTDARAAGLAGRARGAEVREKQVIKEGLSEYFIYTIEGTETIPNGWSKRLRSLEAAAVPLKIQYRYREPEYGPQLVRMYLLKNDKDSKLGTTPLPDGTVRVFRHNGRDGLSFLVAQPIKYIPIGDKIELNLGPDPEVLFELVKLRVRRDNLWMRVDGTDVYRRVDDGAIQIEIQSAVAGWDDHTVYAQRVRNYSAKPIELEVRRTLPGHIVFRSSLEAANHDYQTVQYTAAVKAGQKLDLLYEVVQHQGRNQKQSNVTIEWAEIER